MVYVGVVFLILLIVFIYYINRLDARQAKEKAEKREFQIREIKRLNLTEEQYEKHLFYQHNAEHIRKKCEGLITIPDVVSIYWTDNWGSQMRKDIIVTYDEVNKSKLWKSNLIFPFLFNSRQIIIHSTFDYARLIDAIKDDVYYDTYLFSKNKNYVIDNYKEKTIRLSDLLNLRGENSSDIYSLAEKYLDPSITKEYAEQKKTYQRESNSIRWWAESKNTVAAEMWADKQDDLIASGQRHAYAYFSAKVIFMLYKSFLFRK